MGYSTFANSSKALITSEQIGRGQVNLEHLDPGLFVEFQKLITHIHSGTGSRRVNYRDLTGDIPPSGFYMWSSDSTKRYKVTIDSSTGAFVLTEV